MLEVNNIEILNNNDNRNVNTIIDNDRKKTDNDDITALKQTDTLNEDDNGLVEEVDNLENVEKSDTNLLIINKKGDIDEEIVESVSQLESVITKTIENTKNLDDIPEIEVEQTADDDLLAEVLQPLNPLQVGENPNQFNEDDNLPISNKSNNNNNNNDFNMAEVLDSLTPSSSSTVSVGTNIFRQEQNSPATPAVGVNNKPDNFNDITDSTTPLSFNQQQQHQKDNQHLQQIDSKHHSSNSSHDHDFSSQNSNNSPSQQPQYHTVTSSTLLTEITNSSPLNTNSHLSSSLSSSSSPSSSSSSPSLSIQTDTSTTLMAASSPSSSTLSSSSSMSSSTVSSTNLIKVMCVLFKV